MTRVAVIGGGAWGTTLADLLAHKGMATTLWAREAKVVEGINRRHINTMFLPRCKLAAELRATGDLSRMPCAR